MNARHIDDIRMGAEIELRGYHIPMKYMWHWYDAPEIVMHVLCYGRELDVRLFAYPPGAYPRKECVLSIRQEEIKKLLCGRD